MRQRQRAASHRLRYNTIIKKDKTPKKGTVGFQTAITEKNYEKKKSRQFLSRHKLRKKNIF